MKFIPNTSLFPVFLFNQANIFMQKKKQQKQKNGKKNAE